MMWSFPIAWKQCNLPRRGEDIWDPEILIQCSRRLNKVLNKREFGLIGQDLDVWCIYTSSQVYFYLPEDDIFSAWKQQGIWILCILWVSHYLWECRRNHAERLCGGAVTKDTFPRVSHKRHQEGHCVLSLVWLGETQASWERNYWEGRQTSIQKLYFLTLIFFHLLLFNLF